MKMYRLIIWWDWTQKLDMGIFPEDFCRRFCKEFCGNDNSAHASCVEVK